MLIWKHENEKNIYSFKTITKSIFCPAVAPRVEIEWFSSKNLQVSGRNLQGDASPCKFFFQKLASSYKLTIRLASSYKLNIFCKKLAKSYELTIRSRPGSFL